MKHECENCKHGDTSYNGSRTIVTPTGNVIVQNGGSNTVCTNDHVRNLSLVGDEMICSDFEPKKAL